jgi:hypothetical protein
VKYIEKFSIGQLTAAYANADAQIPTVANAPFQNLFIYFP